MFLLDTDTIIFLLRGHRAVAERIAAVDSGQIATTMISLAELYFGAFYSTRVEENLRVVDQFSGMAQIFSLDRKAAVLFGKLKADLKRDRNMINDSDLFIASIAMATDSILVTNNTRHFRRISGLPLETWAKDQD